MKHLKRTLVMLTAAALAACASAGSRTWDFADGLDGWRFYNWSLAMPGEEKDPAWTTANGLLKQNHKLVWGYALVGEEHWDNYTVLAKIRIDDPYVATSPAGLIVRANFTSDNTLKCHVFGLNLLWDRVSLMLHTINVNGGIQMRSNGGEWMGEEGLELEIGKWYDIRAHVDGDHFQFYIDGSLEFEAFLEGSLEKGAIGFLSIFSILSFDDLTIIGENIEDNLSVKAQQKLAAQWAILKQD